MMQESIFDLTELFSIVFEEMTDPGSAAVPYFSLSPLFLLSQLFCSVLFLFLTVSYLE